MSIFDKRKFKPQWIFIAVLLAACLFAASRESEAGELSLEAHHSSNAGTSRPNLGQDILQACYAFPRIRACAGTTFASGESSDGFTFSLTEDFGKYRLGMGYVSEQRMRPSNEPSVDVMENAYVSATRMFDVTDHVYAGVGLIYWFEENRAISTDLNFTLQLGYRF